MNKKLSLRLTTCLNGLTGLSKIADIGTDHAYLPCFGIATGAISAAIAIDVIDGPLKQAKMTIADYGLAHVIELRKGSGLEPLAIGEVEGVNIAGMGGNLISELLLNSLEVAKSLKRLVLQPQGGEITLRKTLYEHGFKIVAETLVEEAGLIYTVIVAEPTETKEKLTEEQYQFGPFLLKEKEHPLFKKKWQDEVVKLNKVINTIPDSNERKQQFMEKKANILGVINDEQSETSY